MNRRAERKRIPWSKQVETMRKIEAGEPVEKPATIAQPVHRMIETPVMRRQQPETVIHYGYFIP